MVVKAIDEQTKIITTAWFIANNEYQEGTFPAASLDRVEAKPKPKPPHKTPAQKIVPVTLLATFFPSPQSLFPSPYVISIHFAVSGGT